MYLSHSEELSCFLLCRSHAETKDVCISPFSAISSARPAGVQGKPTLSTKVPFSHNAFTKSLVVLGENEMNQRRGWDAQPGREYFAVPSRYCHCGKPTLKKVMDLNLNCHCNNDDCLQALNTPELSIPRGEALRWDRVNFCSVPKCEHLQRTKWELFKKVFASNWSLTVCGSSDAQANRIGWQAKNGQRVCWFHSTKWKPY